MRLMEGADIYQIAKNCRASVEMIEKFYAATSKVASTLRKLMSCAREQRGNRPKSPKLP